MLKGIVRLLVIAAFWSAVYIVGWWIGDHLSRPWLTLVVLSLVLVDLIRITGSDEDGDQDIRYPYNRFPVTLAGPIQPWQEGSHG